MPNHNYPTPAPGWYQDPSGQPGQRYHDGRRWTEHFVPTVPSVPAPAVAVAVSTGGRPNHALHAILTFLSCGLWLPVWVLVAIFGGSSSSVAIANGGNGLGVMARTRRRSGVGVAAVFGGLFLLGLAHEHPWLYVVLIAFAVLSVFAAWTLKSAQARDAELRREQFERDMIANRADREDRFYVQGDPRGIYGGYMPPEFPKGNGNA
ncbi:DUF2510 domain-containing protein [Mycolicibacterium mucogenicum]|uniref:DUF2510 domain-containing protein n=1 Tax=Mycolicibacterium mucogenicum TaxID=56689 RepID=UPI002269A07F|nr:DUF2510 domain-containing protein [Mycolicibacterium mucogenicum]MCX8557516.1 DUF2510 domain-containing protein [Mycolicibacterium mucogenicum]